MMINNFNHVQLDESHYPVKRSDDTKNVVLHDFYTLTFAIWLGNLAIVKTLIGNGAKVNQVGKDGMTPLTIATKVGNKDIVNTIKQAPGNNLFNKIWIFLTNLLKKTS